MIGADFSPVNPLPPSTTVQISASSLLDYAGNTFAPASAQFTTGALPDYSAPTVSFDFPYGQTGVATNASFTCRYSAPMDPSSITPAGVYVYSYVTAATIPVTYNLSSDMMSVTMTPQSPLLAGAEYSYDCSGAIDLTGNAQSYYYYYDEDLFYTGTGPSSAGPVLLQANPPNGYVNLTLNSNGYPWGSSLELLFNEPFATGSLGNITLTPQGGSPIPISVTPEFGDTIAVVQLPYQLQPNTVYTYNVTGVTDVNGNPMTPATSTFTTGSSVDFVNPTVVSSNPANGATNVDVNTQAFSITFSEAMDPVLVNSSEIYVRVHNTGAYVPTTLVLSPDWTTATLTPTAPLAAATIYDLVYWPNDWYLTDIAGNPSYSYGVISTFTTNTPAPTAGVCGSSNGMSFASVPTANLCSAGTASAVLNNGSWTWSCNGENGGSAASCSANVSLQSAPVPQPAGLRSWWPGNDNANDLAGGNNGTLENGTGFALGEVEDAFSFNGNDQYVLIGQPVPANLQIQNAVTYSAWIYITGYPTNQGYGAYEAIMGSEDSNTTSGIGMYLDGEIGLTGIPPGVIEFDIGNGNAWTIAYSTTQLPLNQWVLVTATQTANNPAQIYYNGAPQPTATRGQPWNGTVSYNGSWFAIGQDEVTNWPFNGLIDEVQVYNLALTAGQIQSIYNSGVAGIDEVQTPSITAVTSSASPGEVGNPVTFTATVSPSSATGSVTFMDGLNSLGSQSLSGGQATLATSALALGVHAITAVYSGDATYAGSVSPAFNQIENLDGAKCAPQPAGLLDWYPAEGNTNDLIGGNNGTVEGSVSYAPGVVGQAFSFAGNGDVALTLPSLNTTPGTQVTVSFWMNWSGNNLEMPFGFTAYDLWLYDGYFGFNTGNGDIWGIGSTGLANTWTYVTAVFNNGDPHQNQLYINGTLQTLSQQLSTTSSSAQVAAEARIGSWNNNNNYWFDGLIDEVQIFNGALTAAEVQAIYQAGAAGVCAVETPSTTSVSSSQNPANLGTSVSFTATVSPSAATGTVTFMDGAATLGTSPLSGGQASLSTAALNVGAHNITAVYGGDTAYAGSSSAVLTQSISSNYLSICPGLPSNAVAFWSFDETTGPNAADRLGVSPGTWVDNPFPVPGEVREALSFNGSSYVTVPDSALWNLAGNDFTIELWANFTSSPGGSVGGPGALLVGNDEGGGTTNKWFFAVGGGYLYFHINGPAIGAQFFDLTPFSPVVGQWYHLAIARSGSTYTTYIDGAASETDTNSIVIPTPNAPLTIGEAEGFGFNGIEDELTIYNRALSPSEIESIYLDGSAGKCTE